MCACILESRTTFMRNDIESFLTCMQSILTDDMIKYIVQLVSIDKNIQTIKKQKHLKLQLNKDIIKLFNTYYYDDNFILYKNEHNQFILENMGLINKHIYIYSNRLVEAQNEVVQNNTSPNQMVLYNQTANTTDQIVLFDDTSNQVMYDDNGFVLQRRIKLNIVYVL